MTRDSALWVWGLVVAVIVGVATVDPQTATQTFGIPAAVLPFIRLAAFVVGIVSGKLGNSPLRGEPKS